MLNAQGDGTPEEIAARADRVLESAKDAAARRDVTLEEVLEEIGVEAEMQPLAGVVAVDASRFATQIDDAGADSWSTREPGWYRFRDRLFRWDGSSLNEH